MRDAGHGWLGTTVLSATPTDERIIEGIEDALPPYFWDEVDLEPDRGYWWGVPEEEDPILEAVRAELARVRVPVLR